jgi:nucleoid-associated protein YgaU
MTKNQKIAIGAVLVVSAGALIYSLATYKGHGASVDPEPVASGPTINEIVLNEQTSTGTPATGENLPATPGHSGTLATGTPGTPGIPGVPPTASATSTLAGTTGTPATPGAGTPTQTQTPVEIAEPVKVTYTVKKGDTLHSIAKRELGSENKWKDILAANPSLNPSKMKIGMALQMPAKASSTAAAGTTATPGATPSATVIPASNTGNPGFTPATPVATGTSVTPATPVASGGSTVTSKPKPTAAAPKPAATTAQKSTTRDGVQIYTVRNGDTLRSISKEVYRGDEQKWESVFRLNRDVIGSDPGRLEPGTILILPASGR